MSKKAIIFHGTDCKPSDYWYLWLAEKLTEKGYEVEVPYYPQLNKESIHTFLPQILNNHVFDEDTVIVGHSAGGPLLLSILENLEATLPQAILVAGFSRQLSGGTIDPILQESYDWKRVRQHVKDIVFINSVDDPWGCDAEQGRYMFDMLGGTQIVRKDGHFGSTKYNQAYKEFPLVDKLIP